MNITRHNQVAIYCIEDINDYKYIGSTNETLNKRLSNHKTPSSKCVAKKRLNLYNCIIYELERCSETERWERENYWMERTICVNAQRAS